MVSMELTPEEAEIIEEKRQQEAAKKKAKSDRLGLLRLSYEWEAWLQENGAGATYSTFCDDFGYSGNNRTATYRMVEELRQTANSMIQ